MSKDSNEALTGKNLKEFKELGKLFEQKDYKRGLKSAKKLLYKVPDHGETIAMHALFLYHMGEEEAGLAEAKNAVMKSKLKNQMCWHTYGMLLHQKKDYQEAIKCYQNALRLQPDNMQIMRDMALMQIQVRDHVGHTASRFELLKNRSNLIQNWLSYAVACHLKGDYQHVLRLLPSLETLMLNVTLRPQYKSSYLIFKCLIHQASEKYEDFHAELIKNYAQILDKVIWRELMLDALTKLKRTEEATKLITLMLQDFPDNESYISNYKNIRDIGNDNYSNAHFYKYLSEKFKSKVASLHYLHHLTDKNAFQDEFMKFVIPYYKKNLISLFRYLKPVYDREEHVGWMGEIFRKLEESLRDGKYPNGEEATSPSEYLWSLYLLAQHLSTNFDSLPEALTLIDKAIAHTPSLPELYVTKGKIHNRLHNSKEALQTINEARKMDLADRYLNNLTVKFMFYSGKIQLAEDTMKLFIKDESSTYDLQNMWYEIEEGRAYLKARQFGPGLRHLKMVHKQFQDMYEDQYDFHSYSLRKWNIREYLELIRYMDDIHNDRKYIEAAGLIMKYLIEYSAQPPVEEETKKGKKKKKQEEEELTPKYTYRKNIDYYGENYLKALTNPYAESLIFAKNVVSVHYVNKNNKYLNKLYFKAFAQCINVFIQANKPMLCIKALRKMVRTQYVPEEQHLYIVKALLFLERALKDEKLHAKTRYYVYKYMKSLLSGTTDINAYHEKIISSWAPTYRNQLRKSEARIVMTGDNREDYIKLYQEEIQKEHKLYDVFTLVHKLEQYGYLNNDLRVALHGRYGSKTSYFGDWSQQVDELPKSYWSDWWLSDYDRQREEDEKKGLEKEENDKEKEKTEGKKEQSKATE